MTPSSSSPHQPGGTDGAVAVLLPCYNEAGGIGTVVRQFRTWLPEAVVHVFDNHSTDGTVAEAEASGAIVHRVALRGKGNVVRRMFADVEADIYVMTDGDATYDISNIRALIAPVALHGCDMAVGVRVDDGSTPATYRVGHRWGNQLLTRSVATIFGGSFTDMLSGHRVFSRRYVKSFPAMAQGFETETELTVHALELRMPTAEVPVRYGARPAGTASKLSTYRDGWRILRTIARLFVSEKPMQFFSIVAVLLALAAVLLAVPLLLTYLEEGEVPRLPTAILVTGLMVSAFISFVCGIVLHQVTLARKEVKHLKYLGIAASG